MTELETLDLRLNQVTGDGLEHLQGLTKLRSLDLGANNIPGGLERMQQLRWTPRPFDEIRGNLCSGLEHLRRLKELRSLELGLNKIPDGQLKYLGALGKSGIPRTHGGGGNRPRSSRPAAATEAHVPQLEPYPRHGRRRRDAGEDDVAFGPWTGRYEDRQRGVGKTCSTQESRGLSLGSTNVSDGGLVHLPRLPRLDSLALANNQITDAALVHLSHLPRLRDLDLDNDHITDAGLAVLERLNLKRLSLEDTDITAAGFERLQRALPGAKIHWSPRGEPKSFD